MQDPDLIREASHELRNNLHVIEMALIVLESEDDSRQREELIGALKNELEHTKRNLDRFVGLVQPVDG